MKILIEESVLRQALEAIKGLHDAYNDLCSEDTPNWKSFEFRNAKYKAGHDAITALRAALAELDKTNVCEHQFVTTFGGDHCTKCNAPAPSNEYPL